MELRDKVAIITGGASGIGAACCRAFAREGAKVVAADRDAKGAAAVAEELRGLGVGCDVRREADIRALVDAATKRFGPVDVFFSNAGIANGTDPLETPLDVWQQQWEVHVMSHVHAIRAVLPSMLARKSGYLIQTASMAGILTSQGNAAYATTKHGAVGLAEWMSVTYHDRGVRTSLLAPLGVRTPLLGDPNSAFARLAAGPIREPEEVAEMVVDAVREERFLVLTDPIAQKWIEQKSADPERWLKGMRRLQAKLEEAGGGSVPKMGS
jgi:NAD(P)-dependent dehydrogenase (short-subunit alcohol dehydrogenase family)